MWFRQSSPYHVADQNLPELIVVQWLVITELFAVFFQLLCNMRMHVCVCVCVRDSTPVICVQIFALLFSCNKLSKKYASNVDGNINT